MTVNGVTPLARSLKKIYINDKVLIIQKGGENDMYLSKRVIYVKLDNEQGVLFNTLSGAIDIIDDNIAKSLWNGRWDAISQETKNVLLERSYVFESSQKETSEFMRLYELMKERDAKLAPEFVIIPTYQCNLRCQYCYERDLQDKGSLLDVGLLDLLWQAMDSIANNYTYEEVPQLTIMGGEPLLRCNYKIIKDILRGCFQRKWKVEIISNGTSLTQYASLLSRYKVKGIQVTLDGTRDIHNRRRMFQSGKGSFDQIIKGITEMIKREIKIYLRVNLDSQNLNHLPFLANFIQERKWMESRLVFPYLYAMSDSGCLQKLYIIKETDVLKKIIELSEKYPEMAIFDWKFHGLDHFEAVLQGEIFSPMLRFCSATKNQYVFDARGKIYACWWGVGRQEFEIGEVAPRLHWYQDNLKQWRDRNILVIPACSQCKFALICGGGCAEKAIQEEGGINQPRCSLFKEIFSSAIPFLIKRCRL